MSGQWEVVSRKKNRNDTGNKNVQRQKLKGHGAQHKDMPKLEETVPIQESPTMFEGFIENERKKAQQAENKLNGLTANAKHKDAHTKKKHQDKKKGHPPQKIQSLEDAVKLLDIEEMRTHCATVEARFPEAPMIWLQDLASFLNVKLDVEILDPVFSSNPTGYPTSLLSSDVRELIRNIFNSCPSQTLELFFDYCLISMVQDTVKGISTFGYRICLQCLAQKRPGIVLGLLSKCIDFRNSYQNRQNVCLSILWAAGQAGNKSLETGLKVWCEVMFPILGTKAYSKFVVEYLENLFSSHKSTKCDKAILSVKDLFPILDYVHSSAVLPANLQNKLSSLYPRLKALSYGSEPSSVLRNFFPSYLRRLEPNCSKSMRTEVLSSLVECLTVDKLSYSNWRQLYTKHLAQSNSLICHLNEEWDKIGSSFPRQLLYETLSTFQVTNEELIGQGRKTKDVEDCISSCNALMYKMSAQRFPWAKLLFSVLVVVTALLTYDVHIHGSFKNSKTGELMREVGLLAICEQAWGKITVYTGKTYKWLEVNMPVFNSWMCQTFGPYLQLFWEKLFTLCIYLWNSTEGIRSWANTNVPPMLEFLSENLPVFGRAVSKYAEVVILYLANGLYTMFKFVEQYTSIVIAWLHKNVFTGSLSAENLQKYAGNAVETFQQYALSTFNWISRNVATVVYPGK